MATADMTGMLARLRRALPLCLSAAAHLAALLLLSQQAGGRGQAAQTQAPRVLQVSLVQHAPSRQATVPEVPPPLQKTPPLQSLPPAQAALRRSAPVATAATAPSNPGTGSPATAAPENIPDTPQPARLAETSAGTLPEPRYYLLRELSVRPMVLEDATPSLGFEGVPAQIVILRLFINEEGGIDRVATEQSVLPEAHAQKLIDTFSRARFLPGRIDDAPVKSQMRIEVRLESAPQRDVSL